MMVSLMVTKHARWRVLSVGAGLARAVENYKGWTDADLRHRESERERERDVTLCVCHCYDLCSLLNAQESIIMPHLCLLSLEMV